MDGDEDEIDKKSTKGPISRTVHEYADVATTHGIYYIFEAGRLMVERIFWVIVVILALVFAISLSISAYSNWKDDPVLTSVGTTGHPIEKISFPSITICPQGSANEIIDAALFKQFERYLAGKGKMANELSEKTLKEEGVSFLSLIYPGAKQGPTQMIKMLGSPGLAPDKSLEAQAVLNPEDKSQCGNKNLIGNKLKCPDGFIQVSDFDNHNTACWNFQGQSKKMSRSEGVDYCEALLGNDTWSYFYINDRSNWDILWKIVATGRSVDGSQVYDSGKWAEGHWTSPKRGDDGMFKVGARSDNNLTESWNYIGGNVEDDSTNYLPENMDKMCLVLYAKENQPGNFSIKAADCDDEKHLVICRTDPVLEDMDNIGFPCLDARNDTTLTPVTTTETSVTYSETDINSTNVMKNTSNCGEDIVTDTSIGIQKLNLVFKPCMSEKKEQLRKDAKEEYERTIGSLDMQTSFEHLFELLWYSQLPCFDVQNITSSVKDEMSLIKRCYWKGKEISCASIFVTRPTDRGMCCSFNMEKAEKIFRKGKYGNMVSTMQETDKLGSFDNTSFPTWYTEQEEPSTQPGQNKGLMLVLDAHTDKVSSGSVSDNFKGFVTVVDDSGNYPLTQTNGFLVRPGRENHVALSALEIHGNEAIRNIKPEDRDCYFSDEHPLEEHQKYSQSNCVLECNMKYARKKMEEQNATTVCTPWFYPISDADISQFCDPWDTAEFENLMASAPDEECSSCLPDCTKTIYEATVSAAPFRQCDHTNLGTSQLCDLEDVNMNPPIWQQLVQNEYLSAKGKVPEFAEPSDERMSNTRSFVSSEEKQAYLVFQVKNNKTPDYDAYTNDIAIVNFYFDKSTVLLYKRDQRMTTIDYISQMGGLLGLGIGMSFLSIIEILYWMTIRLGRNISGSKVKNT